MAAFMVVSRSIEIIGKWVVVLRAMSLRHFFMERAQSVHLSGLSTVLVGAISKYKGLDLNPSALIIYISSI